MSGVSILVAVVLLAPVLSAAALADPSTVGFSVGVVDRAAPRAGPDAGAPEGANATDPQGDAYEWTPNAAQRVVRNTMCHAYSNATVHEACDNAWAKVPAADGPGTPAPPSMDIISLGFVETPEAIIASIGVASLDEALTGLRGGNDTGSSFYIWYPLQGPGEFEANVPERYVKVNFLPNVKPFAFLEGTCWECEWEIPFELEFGSPGYIHLTLPRDYLPDGEKGGFLPTPYAYVYRSVAGPSTGFGVRTDSSGYGGGFSPSAGNEVDNVTSPGPLLFRLERARPDWSAEASEWIVDGPRNVARPNVPVPANAVLRTVRVVDTPAELGVALQFELVDLNSTNLYVGLIIPGAWVGMSVDGQNEPAYMRSIVKWEADGVADYNEGHPIDVQLAVSPGPMGWMNVTWARTDLGSPPAGTVIGWVGVGVGDYGAFFAGGNRVGIWNSLVAGPSNLEGNAAGYGPFDPFHLRNDTALPGIVPTATFVKDAIGDVTLPPLANAAGTSYKDRVDITFLEVKGVAPGESRVTLGVRDLSRVTVPTGYRAVAYAAAIDTANGPSMVVYYKTGEQDGGRQEFFCAPDNAVLASQRANPYDAVRMVIDGIVVASSPAGGGESDAIVFAVPNTCFGADVGDRLEGTLMAAATFLIGNGATLGVPEVEMLDEVRADEPSLLGMPSPPPPVAASVPWYDSPMGIRGFWDMLGIAIAGAAVVGGGAYKLHQRGRDQRAVANAKLREDRDVYRDALRKAVASGTKEPGKDPVLTALRRRLGVGEREHAMMLLQARSAAGLSTGLATGERFLERYRIDRVLGEGGFARTFLAQDEKLDRRVVLKVARWDDPKEAARALKEGRTLARLGHPNIVAIHDVEEVGGEAVLVLEHMPRGSLADVLKKGPLTTAEALSVADDVLAALEAAHRQGIVHRDVKPANILLTAEGRAKLADFGIARDAAGKGTAGPTTGREAGAGTLQYMSPEQARGVPADPSSDLYGVGAVMYEVLAGHTYLPFDSLQPFEARLAIIQDPPIFPIRGVPQAVNSVLAKALAKDSKDRPSSAAEMRRLLAAAAAARAPTTR